MIGLNLLIPPQGEPIDLPAVEGQCRIGDLSAEESTVNMFIAAIREEAESRMRRALITQQWEMVLDGFPLGRDAIKIPMPPLQSVDSITYLDPLGATQTMAPELYRILADSSPACQPGYVMPVYGQLWPATLPDMATVRIKFTCGYGPIVDPADPGASQPNNIPKGIMQWMLINIANLYENRESETVASGRLTQVDLSTMADGLLNNYIVRIF
jgi:uncharacterized phiE125 gp8 family phage protein